MPSILQLAAIEYDVIADTLFFAGTEIRSSSQGGFIIAGNGFTIRFTGDDLTYDENGRLSGGTLEEYRLYDGSIQSGEQLLIVSSNFTLLTTEELNAAFELFDAGQTDLAAQLVIKSWTSEFFSHTNGSGGELRGFRGDDAVFGGFQSDIIYGRRGDDSVAGNGGDDILFGEDGNDFVFGGSGRDRLFGGNGNDVLFGEDDDDLLVGGQGDDSLDGDNGNDILRGGGGNDILDGDRGNDTLSGGRGDDTLSGDIGMDVLDDGLGSDTLSGGGNSDTFIITDGAGDTDTITDFQNNLDTLDLRAFGFASDADLEAAASDVGRRMVLIDLGEGQTLTVNGVREADLIDDVLIF